MQYACPPVTESIFPISCGCEITKRKGKKLPLRDPPRMVLEIVRHFLSASVSPYSIVRSERGGLASVPSYAIVRREKGSSYSAAFFSLSLGRGSPIAKYFN